MHKSNRTRGCVEIYALILPCVLHTNTPATEWYNETLELNLHNRGNNKPLVGWNIWDYSKNFALLPHTNTHKHARTRLRLATMILLLDREQTLNTYTYTRTPLLLDRTTFRRRAAPEGAKPY